MGKQEQHDLHKQELRLVLGTALNFAHLLAHEPAGALSPVQQAYQQKIIANGMEALEVVDKIFDGPSRDSASDQDV